MVTRWKLNCGRAATMLCVAACTQVYAADALEEVVVTATKRGETDVQKTAESVYAVSGADLSLKRETTFEAFAGSVPGLQFQNLGPGDSEYIIRGINGSGPSVVGAYLDEYVITASDQQDGGGKNAPIQLVDVERIEVLNGPQGTLYGSNSMAGNIRFITNKPDASKFDANAEADWSTIADGGDGFGLSAMVNVPLSPDKLAIRFVGYREDRDGWVDQARLERGAVFNGVNEDINTTEITGGRLSARWTPSDALSLDVMYVMQDLESDGSSRFTSKGVPAYPDQPPEIASLPGNTGFAPLPGLASFTPGRDFINTDITRSPREDDFDLFGATLRYDMGFGSASLAASRYEHDITLQLRQHAHPAVLRRADRRHHAAAAGVQHQDGGAALRLELRLTVQLRHGRVLSERRQRVQRARHHHRRHRQAAAVQPAELGRRAAERRQHVLRTHARGRSGAAGTLRRGDVQVRRALDVSRRLALVGLGAAIDPGDVAQLRSERAGAGRGPARSARRSTAMLSACSSRTTARRCRS